MKMIPVPMGPELIREMMAAMKAGDYTNRSEFIRDAIVEKAVALGLEVPASLARPPQRVIYPVPESRSALLNEEKALDAALKEQEILGAGQLGAKAAVTKLGLKPKAASTTGKKGGPARPAPRASSGPQSPPKPAPTAHGS